MEKSRLKATENNPVYGAFSLRQRLEPLAALVDRNIARVEAKRSGGAGAGEEGEKEG